MPLPPLSYTFISDYENCPKKAWHKYVAKDLPPIPQSDEMAHGIAVHKALEDRVERKVPLPATYPYEPLVERLQAPPGGKVKAEWKLGIAASGRWVGFFTSGVWLRGKADVTIVNADATKAMLFDWKTGKVREDPFELQVQALLLKGNIPDLSTIRGAYVWLKESRVGQAYDLSDTKATMARIKAVEQRMVAGQWDPEPNPLCGWCDVMKCQYNRREK